MKKFWVVALIVVVVLSLGAIMKKNNESKKMIGSGAELIDCTSQIDENPECFLNAFLACAPAKMEIESQNIKASLVVFGEKNNKCDYAMDINGSGIKCSFESQNLTEDLFAELLGEPYGEESAITSSCVQY